MKSRGKGNKKAQRQRRRRRNKNLPPRMPYKVQLMDGNWSFFPAAYCKKHQAYITQGLIDTHKCKERECDGIEWLNE